MALYLQSNTSALVAQNYFNQSQMAIQSSFTKLSSGYRINSAADDAAGLGIAKSLNAQVQSYGVASQNANDAVSMVQTADGSADQIDSLLTRMRELAVEAQNGTMSSNDVTNLGTEFGQDLSEIDRVAGDATFNGKALLAGSTTAVNFQVGINGTTNDQISVTFGGCDSSGLGLTGATVTGVDDPDDDRQRDADAEQQPRRVRCGHEPPARRLEPDHLDADEPVLGAQLDPGRRRRDGDREPRPRASPRASRRLGPLAGESGAAACSEAAWLIVRSRKAESKSACHVQLRNSCCAWHAALTMVVSAKAAGVRLATRRRSRS